MAEPREAERTQPNLEEARRAARFTFARRRIEKIVGGAPPLTQAQREQLALLLYPGAGEAVADAS